MVQEVEVVGFNTVHMAWAAHMEEAMAATKAPRLVLMLSLES